MLDARGQEIEVGSVARLQCSPIADGEGAPMTVDALALGVDEQSEGEATDRVHCVWFEGTTLRKEYFAPLDLEVVQKNDVDRTLAQFPELTDRERAVALLLVQGEKNKDIAEQLDVSVKTVDTHRLHLLKKLGVKNNVLLARLAIRRGYVQP